MARRKSKSPPPAVDVNKLQEIGAKAVVTDPPEKYIMVRAPEDLKYIPAALLNDNGLAYEATRLGVLPKEEAVRAARARRDGPSCTRVVEFCAGDEIRRFRFREQSLANLDWVMADAVDGMCSDLRVSEVRLTKISDFVSYGLYVVDISETLPAEGRILKRSA